MNTLEMFAEDNGTGPVSLGAGITLLRGFADTSVLMPLIAEVSAKAPFRHLVTPGGQTMSVAMTNCGPVGWVSDRNGYRYSSRDPLSDRDWPRMPAQLGKPGVDGARGGHYKAQPALAGADDPPGRDEDADPAGIAEQDVGEVQDEAVPPLGHLVVHALPQHR